MPAHGIACRGVHGPVRVAGLASAVCTVLFALPSTGWQVQAGSALPSVAARRYGNPCRGRAWDHARGCR